MKQSKQAEEILELMGVVDQLREDGVIYATQASDNKPYTGGPGKAEKKYSKEQVMQMLDYCKAYITKDAAMKYNDNWLTKLGLGMEEFLKLRSGDPALDYKEGDIGADQHAEPYSKISFKNADKGKANQDMRSSGPGSVRGKDNPRTSNIGDEKLDISFGKAPKGKKVDYSTEH